MPKHTFFFLLLSLVLFSQCTVQKRVHRSGWHITWNKSHSKPANKLLNEEQIQNDLSLEQSNEETSPVETPEILKDSSDQVIHSNEDQSEEKTNPSNPISSIIQSKTKSDWVKKFVQEELKKSTKPKPTWLAVEKNAMIILLSILFLLASLIFSVILYKLYHEENTLLEALTRIVGIVIFAVIAIFLLILLLITLITPSYEGQQNRKAKHEKAKELAKQQQTSTSTPDSPTSTNETVENNESSSHADEKTKSNKNSLTRTFVAIGVGIALIATFLFISK